MADDSFNDGRASEEPYTRIRTLGRGAFGEAVLYRKTEVSFSLKLSSCSRNRMFCKQIDIGLPENVNYHFDFL